MAGIRLIIAVAGIGSVLMAGCQSSANLAGQWAGMRESRGVPIEDPVLDASARKVRLNIESNGKFTLADGGIPMEGDIAGENLDVRRVLNREIPIEARPKYTIKRDGEGLIFSDGKETVLLKKYTKP